MTRACKVIAVAVLLCQLAPAVAAARPAPAQLPPLQPAYVPPSQAPGYQPPPHVDPQPGRTSRCIHQAATLPASQRSVYIHRCMNG